MAQKRWTPTRSNLSPDSVKEFWQRQQEIAARNRALADERRALSRDMKGAGINLRMWNRATAEVLRSVEDIQQDQRDYHLYLAFMDKPLGFQSEMSFGAITAAPPVVPVVERMEKIKTVVEKVVGFPPSEKPKWGGLTGTARQRIFEAGELNGVQSTGRAQDNPWVPGSESHALWEAGWYAGRAASQKTSANAAPRRGRPLGRRDLVPRKRRGPRRKVPAPNGLHP